MQLNVRQHPIQLALKYIILKYFISISIIFKSMMYFFILQGFAGKPGQNQHLLAINPPAPA